MNRTTAPPSRIDQDREIEAVRRAWRLTEPEPTYSDPPWLKTAMRQAAERGDLPQRRAWEQLTHVLDRAGYSHLVDHPFVIKADGERHVCLEPYYSVCTERATSDAKRLGELLLCNVRVSLRSWHYPGFTIRITFAPKQTTEVNESNE
ncbi:hypothetical protein [Novipirellula aureliae]|nr:hypothetical protein [Novipirellula aureliae]